MNITETLATQRKGRFLIEAQAMLQDVVKAVGATGKKGSLTIKLTIVPADTGVVLVLDELNPKIPQPNKASTTFYAEEDGSLHREDPNQKELEGIVDMKTEAAGQ